VHADESAIVAGVGVAYVLAAAWTARASARIGVHVPQHATPLLENETTTTFTGGEMVAVRAYAGYRAQEEPRAIVLGDREWTIDGVDWRAVEERDGRRRRVFAVRVAGQRVRLAYNESSELWEIDRVIGGT
jgi:hypothetical protein